MKHFSIWQWVDHVRGLDEEGTRPAMDAHLSSGCRRCGRIVDVLRGVVRTAQGERSFEPSEQALRNAQAIYPLYAAESESLPRLVARLLHDSFLAPQPAGLRTQSRVARHALFLAGSYHLDLQLEHQPASGMVTLTGQLADQSRPDASRAGTPVWLKERKRLVATTLCNQFGEFHFQYDIERDLKLHLPLPTDGKRLEIELNSLNPAPVSRRPATPRRRPVRRR
jgi:hypothetical protein